MKKVKKNKKVASLSTVISIIIIVVLSLLGYFMTKNKVINTNNTQKDTQQNTGNVSKNDKQTLLEFANSITYENDNTVYTGYYSKLNNVSDENFLDTLTQIINDGAILQPYVNANRVFLKSDTVKVNNQTLFFGMYDSKLYDTHWNGQKYNREHVWPNSRLGQQRVKMNERSIASDYHNLRMIEANINRTRNNYKFVDGKGVGHLISQNSFYPGDDHKGDVARILLYMAVKYPKLHLVINPTGTSYTSSAMQMGDVRNFIKWHQEDKVKDFEKNRNQQIYLVQKNRNPFIDNPQLYKKVLKLKLLRQFKENNKKEAKINNYKNYKLFIYKEKSYIKETY